MRILMNVSIILLLTTCFMSGSGCSGNNEKIVSVTGTVTHNGKPVPGMVVSFVPQQMTVTGVSTGETDEQGRYELTVFSSGQSGAVVGMHKVWISLPRKEPTQVVDKDERMMKKKEEKNKKKGGPGTEMMPTEIAKILKKYGSLDKTPLTKEVKGDPIDLNLD
ncbi:MAG TPA: hypothetical protein VGP68_08485 [Gemmataceae bacterium]|jgi:hypothetical protein|nr:hypothetical protein [Gemmataceae bacterium]